MRRIFVFILFFIWMDAGLLAQVPVPPEKSHHFAPSVSLGWHSFRDFATSPLFYSGPGLGLSLGDRWEKPTGFVWFNTTVHAAMTLAIAPQSDYLQAGGSAFFLDMRLDGGYLHRLKGASSPGLDLFAGGCAVTDLVLRQNGGLGNAQVGTDVLANLMGSVKANLDISRESADTLNLKLIRLRRKPKQQRFDAQLNVGLLNLNYRPGYAYVYDAELVGEPGLSWALADHRWSLNGWRLSSALGYQRRHATGHSTRLEYVWEALHAPGRYRALQFASHRLRIVFMFNTTKPKLR